MEQIPKVSRITVYPIKSLDGIEIESSRILPAGALEYDREYALMTHEGQYIHGKKFPEIHAVRAKYNLDEKTVSLTTPLQQGVFHLDNDRQELQNFLSEYFGFQVIMRRNQVAGFPDDSERGGPTFISQATLETVNSWFPQFDLENIRLRFRANIELIDTPPFWEDQLTAPLRSHTFFRVGEVLVRGRKICKRCVVPTRDPFTGEITPNFMRTFMDKRAKSLPNFVKYEDFDHFYYLAINTNIDIDQIEKRISRGDELKMMS